MQASVLGPQSVDGVCGGSLVHTESAEGTRVAEGASAEGAVVAEGLAP